MPRELALVEQVFDFVINHYILVSAFVFLLVAFVINEGKQGGAAITPTNLVNLVNREGAVLLDIRDIKEYGAGHIAGAMSMPVSSIDARIGELDAYKDKPVVLVCKMGQHASATGRKLKDLGFEMFGDCPAVWANGPRTVCRWSSSDFES